MCWPRRSASPPSNRFWALCERRPSACEKPAAERERTISEIRRKPAPIGARSKQNGDGHETSDAKEMDGLGLRGPGPGGHERGRGGANRGRCGQDRKSVVLGKECRS